MTRMSKKKKSTTPLLITLSTLFIFSTVLSYTLSVSAQTEKPIAKVIAASDPVFAAKPNHAPRSLKRGFPIFANEILQTGEKGFLQVRFSDNTLLSLKPNTNFRTDAYALGKQKHSEANYRATLLKGGFKVMTGLIAKRNPNHFKVKSRVATITVRGTTFLGFYDTLQKRFSAGVIKGTIALQQCASGQAPNAAGLCPCSEKTLQEACQPRVLPVTTINGQAGFAQATMAGMTQLASPPPELTIGYFSSTGNASPQNAPPQAPSSDPIEPKITRTMESLSAPAQEEQIQTACTTGECPEGGSP